MLKVLVACEFSGRVRNAFAMGGHTVVSCDLTSTEQDCIGDSYHVVGDIRDLLANDPQWDLLIAHPPCTFLCLSGVSWLYHPDDAAHKVPDFLRREHPMYPGRRQEMEKAIELFLFLKNQKQIPKIAIENSRMHGESVRVCGKPTQLIHPYMFGDPYKKATCLWLKGLPKLQPTNVTAERYEFLDNTARSERGRQDRSRTFPGVAEAMAAQWGSN